ncbi:hypothetical protein DV735_g2004, partial [Chaetothyriales sp. CBS 134920]
MKSWRPNWASRFNAKILHFLTTVSSALNPPLPRRCASQGHVYDVLDQVHHVVRLMPRPPALGRPAALLRSHRLRPLATSSPLPPLSSPLLTPSSSSPSSALRVTVRCQTTSNLPLPPHHFQKRYSSSKTGHRPAVLASSQPWAHEEYAEVVPKSEIADEQPARSSQPEPDAASPAPSASFSGFFDPHETAKFAAGSTLPHAWFIDVANLQQKLRNEPGDRDQEPPSEPGTDHPVHQSDTAVQSPESAASRRLGAQVKLLQAVRELETKLAHAKADLASFLSQPGASSAQTDSQSSDVMTLTKEDYKGLVDLYYYTHMRRFGPDAPDHSPTPLLLRDYAFKLSEDFAPPDAFAHYYIDEDDYQSPLRDIDKALRSRQMREITAMQAFVDLLLDDHSSNKALFDAYKQLPSPGVAYLPSGVIRLFLQRMSTPWAKSEKAMLRYLSLIDDMQRANLPISRAEWSSAIYLAGRSFPRVTTHDMKFAFKLWREMEQEAGVQSHHVTFNILFDIAVRAGRFPIAQSMLKEMHDRGLKLNRLGRVTLIFYHGLREDGDAVRKAYRDFIDAGEIVDTLVLTCVMASLFNAGEPTAAEQIYERMKDLQKRFQLRQRPDGSETLYMRYPKGAHSHTIDHEMASNSLGRVLLKAPNLKRVLPEHHQELQSIMPLTPNYKTFGAMIAHHANVSGNLDRLTVIMNEMVELFNLPFRPVHFQLLFKGFALHGSMNEHSTWNLQRLDLAWAACKSAIQTAAAASKRSKTAAAASAPEATLASIQAIETGDGAAPQPSEPALPKRRKLSPWNELVVDLALFPQQRRKDIERVHSQLFDDDKHHPPSGSHSTKQETYYPLGLGHTDLDQEEGEYTLPSPVEAIAPNHQTATNSGDECEATDAEERRAATEFRANRPMICWLLRAYATCSGRREKLEEVWADARRVWRPLDENERQSAYRVLRRCLRDCDRHEAFGL